jgi:DNA-binding NarL/FixJ family response regulator
MDPAFSSRELEVLRLISLGKTNAQCGEILFITERTIETHVDTMLAKSNLSNRVALLFYCVAKGLIPFPDPSELEKNCKRGKHERI